MGLYIYSLYLQVGLNSTGKNSNPKHKCHYVVTDTNTTVNTLHCYIEKQLCEQWIPNWAVSSRQYYFFLLWLASVSIWKAMHNLPAKHSRTHIIKPWSVKQKKHQGAPEQINTLKRQFLLVWIECHTVTLVLLLVPKGSSFTADLGSTRSIYQIGSSISNGNIHLHDCSLVLIFQRYKGFGK